jgi:hypothetical protein
MLNATQHTELVTGRLQAALRNETYAAQALAAGVHLSMEPTAGEVLRLVAATGLDPVLLTCRLQDVDRGLDDLPSFDAYGARN